MPTSPGPLLTALSALWERLRADVPELPPLRPVLSPTPRLADHRPRWSVDEEGFLTGLVVNVDTLQAGPDVTLETLLHDAAHVLSWRRDISDVTMNGVYHNREFLASAEEVGLIWPEDAARVQGKGFPNPQLSDAARKRHAADLRALADVIPEVLPHLELPSTSRTGRVDRLALRCACEPARSFRISRTIAAKGPIVCGVCGQPFTEE